MGRLASVYVAEMKIGVQNQFQYWVSVFFQLLGFLIEPIVYLVVWRTVAAQAGTIGGYGVADFTAYYIVWTLVRNMNLALTPYVWDWWIQRGRVSDMLLRPVHIFHRQLASFAGFKFVWILLWVPIAAGLVLAFQPELHPTWGQAIAFFVAIWGGYVVRFSLLFLLGLGSFWTTRASAMFEIVIAAELLLSGRLVPLSVMPDWVESLAALLPFQWTFQFPIETLIGKLSAGEILFGLAAQVVWFAILGGAIALVWRRAIRRYTAVGT
jgi:ABC-2 type transport system permease protein